jgi:glyoxylase-like metal-dependent hydrolase (beta-lactamase superfamily II)
MKCFASGLAPLLWLLLPLASAGQPVTNVEKVAEGIWTAQTAASSNAGWFLVGDEVVAVDSGGDAATGKALLDKIRETAGKPVRYLIVTHAHGDHGAGAGPFAAAGAEVICHENAAPGVATIVSSASKSKISLVSFSERVALFGGPRRIAVYFLGAAHSASDIFVLLPDDKVLFSGDVVLGKRAPYMQSPDVDPKGWETILARLEKLDIEKIVPGHGTVGGKELIADTYGSVKKVNELASMLLLEKTRDDLIEARLRRPDAGLGAVTITPELLANIRASMKAQSAKSSPIPEKPAKKATPAKKKG